MVVTTLFLSEKLKEGIPYRTLYSYIIDKFSIFCSHLGYEHEDKCIIYNDTKIEYRLLYQNQLKRYFLNFKPKNPREHAKKIELSKAFDDTLDFFNKLNPKLDFDKITFFKVPVTGIIDVKDWTFSTEPSLQYYKLEHLTWRNIDKIGDAFYQHYINKIDKKMIAINCVSGVEQFNFHNYIEKISPLFKDKDIQIIKRTDYTLEEISVRSDKNRIFVIYFGDDDSFEKDYKKYKHYFISNDIPSQFSNVKNYDNTMGYGFDNLVFEILKKAYKDDFICLDTPNFIDIDGFLCLSDIYQASKTKFFGISITLRGQGTTEDFMEIYNDVNYKADPDYIAFEEEDILKLSLKIQALSNLKNKKIDVYVDKKWRIRDVGKLIRFLSENKINVRRFLYISNKTNRFIFSNLKNEDIHSLNKHPYIIWDGRVASIQTNSIFQLYGTMFPIYIELLNHWTTDILNEKDMMMILWLVKKRIYRIKNYYNIRTPETIKIFKEVKNMDLMSMKNKMRISTHMLI